MPEFCNVDSEGKISIITIQRLKVANWLRLTADVDLLVLNSSEVG